ncbi:hypothetical protein D9613_003350 [Agrocybe pediades]|uniref:Methyltransferase domain-containing protein n=1 Tax=Agrocybe pediades TaxID=84607 RepID=A0A8H4VPE8_9AGAR|nr:hypothetical protein D9613_003350 [Agrocybe pediades]
MSLFMLQSLWFTMFMLVRVTMSSKLYKVEVNSCFLASQNDPNICFISFLSEPIILKYATHYLFGSSCRRHSSHIAKMSGQLNLPMLDLDHPSLKPKVEYYNIGEKQHDHPSGQDAHSHAHNHSEHHHHHQHKDASVNMVEENKKHFNEIASHNHEDPRWITLAQRTAVEMRKKYQFDKNSTVLLDFATNAGLIARELEPYAKKIVGVDISDGPVNIFNEWVAKKGISAEKMHAVAVELEGKEGELDGLKFDVITCGASYHHFEDINKMTKMLTSFLKPNGVLLVVDVTKVNSEKALPSDHTHDHFVPHKAGLTSESMEEAFTKAGLTGFNFELFSKVRMLGNESFLFIASGKKE